MRALSTFVFLVIEAVVMGQFPLVRSLEVRTGQRRPHVTEVAQDRQGLLWAASDAGLLRTDGERVEVVLPVEGDDIVALATAAVGVVVATFDGALVHCSGLRCDTLMVDTLWRATAVSALAVGTDGTVWIGTRGAGLIGWNDRERIALTTATGLPDDHVNDLDLFPDGRVVVATDQGLAICRRGRVEATMGEIQGAPDNLVLSVTVVDDGSVWAGTDRRGVFQWDLNEGPRSVRTFAGDWTFGPVRDVRGSGGIIWAGTETHGPIAIDLDLERGTYSLQQAQGKPVLDLLVDHDGAVWWCDGTELLQRADPAILVVPEHEAIDLRSITALCTDPRGRIWFATADGLFNHVAYFSEERTVTRVPVPIDPLAPIVSLAADSAGNLWAATFGKGVYRIRADGGVDHFTTEDGLSNNNVLGVRTSAMGMLFATLEGVSVFNKDSWRQAGKEAGFIFDVTSDAGVLYMATDGRGLRFEGPSGSGRASADNGTYYALMKDDTGGTWAAGPGTGFCHLTANGFACLGAKLPPFDGDVYALGKLAGRIIAFGATGVCAYDPGSGAIADLTATFGLEDATAELNVTATDASGALWYACSKGLVRFRSAPTHFQRTVPTAVLAVRLGNEEVPLDSHAQVPYDHDLLAVRFTGLHYADPAAVRFEHRLLGHDGIVRRTRDREVSYAALPPGDYTFGLRAFVGNDAGDAPWQEFHFTIRPPWWRTPWAIIGALLLISAIVFLILRAREQRIRYRDRMEKDKVRFQLDALRSQVDPHFLFNSFNALVELIESDPAVAVQHVDQLSTFFRNILLVRDRERITLAEEIGLLENYFALEQRRFGAAIQLDVQVPEPARGMEIVPLTLQLLVENALKHNVVTGADPFVIMVHATADQVQVSNPVRTKLTAPRSTGFGLDSITRRYAALTARPVEVVRESGRFTVRIPLIEPAA